MEIEVKIIAKMVLPPAYSLIPQSQIIKGAFKIKAMVPTGVWINEFKMIEIPVTPPGAIWFGSENTETEIPYKIPPNVKHKISKNIFCNISFVL